MKMYTVEETEENKKRGKVSIDKTVVLDKIEKLIEKSNKAKTKTKEKKMDNKNYPKKG